MTLVVYEDAYEDAYEAAIDRRTHMPIITDAASC